MFSGFQSWLGGKDDVQGVGDGIGKGNAGPASERREDDGALSGPFGGPQTLNPVPLRVAL